MLSRSTRRTLLAAAATGLAAAAIAAAPAAAAPGDLDLVSRATDGTAATGFSSASAVSADGRFVAFESLAPNLSDDDADGVQDIFVRDMVTGETVLVSRMSATAGGAGADADSSQPSISADGRYVAFTSNADNLSAQDDDDVQDVFVRDVQAQETFLVSVPPGGGAADGNSVQPDISADGVRVAFISEADNLSAEDDDVVPDAFLRDRQAGTTTLVTRRSQADGGAGADGPVSRVAISPDGGFVGFSSTADNLSDEDGPADDVFLRDVAAQTTTLVSRRSASEGGAAANAASSDVDVAASGRVVAFVSDATDLSAADTDPASDVYVRDMPTGTTTLVSRQSATAGGAGADEAAVGPGISDDGRMVVFQSAARNLAATAAGAGEGIFVRDTALETTALVSRRSDAEGGEPAEAISQDAAISADGRHVVFRSTADNLSAIDVDGFLSDVFRRDLGAPAPIPVAPPPAPPVTGGTTAPAGTTTAADLCAPAPPATTPSTGKGQVALTTTQLRINQRISQAAIRRLNAVQAWLDAGVEARDVCGGALGQGELTPGATHEVAAAPLATLPVADPRPVTPEPASPKSGIRFTLSAAQFLINQRIDQAAVRRANALEARLASGLTGGDVRDGALTQGRLHDRLHVLAVPAGQVPASETVIAPRATPADPDSVEVSAAQLAINQRIAQAGVRRSNALIARLETGLTADEFRDGTIGAADLAPGVVG